ncbi:MAG: hypothetical protein AMXMBFR44_4330 [Candidatus Campbellbacteria bacterium]
MHLSIKEMFRASWATFKKNAWMFVGATAVVGVASVVLDSLSDNTDGLIEAIISVFTAVTLWWLYMGFLRMALTAYAGGMLKFEMLFSGRWPMLLQFAIASLLTGIIVAIGIVLLIVPGIIAQMGLLFAALFVVDKGMKGIDAMKASWKLTKGHRWNLFLAFLVLILFNVAGALAFGVGLLVTVPMSLVALVYLYRELDRGIQPQVVSAAPAAAPQA